MRPSSTSASRASSGSCSTSSKPSRVERKIAVGSGSAWMQQQKYQSGSISSSCSGPSVEGESTPAAGVEDPLAQDRVALRRGPLAGRAEPEHHPPCGIGERQEVRRALRRQRSGGEQPPEIDLLQVDAVEQGPRRPEVDAGPQGEPEAAGLLGGEELVHGGRLVSQPVDRAQLAAETGREAFEQRLAERRVPRRPAAAQKG